MPTSRFESLDPFKKRRENLAGLSENSLFIFFSGKDTHLSRFRARSSFVYFSAFEEPEAMVAIKSGPNPSYHLFVREKNPDMEIWDGEMFGVDGAAKTFGADETHSIDQVDAILPKLMTGVDRIYYSLGEDLEQDDIVLQARTNSASYNGRSGAGLPDISDPKNLVNLLRVKKDDLEISLMKEACSLSSKAHIHVMKNIKPGMNERQVQALLFYSFYDQQADREGYSSIIASGPNACTLHYRDNNRDMNDGEFLLIDAGAEKCFYTADITRTYPVNGKFTPAQKDLYAAVLESQKKLIDQSKEGASLVGLQDLACELLTQNMIDLGLLKGNLSDLIAEGAHRKFYPHRIGHYLGMDVHDVGFSKQGDEPTPLEENMIITIEPGIYVPPGDSSAPKELQGLGVRIEDDVLIRASGNEVLTQETPKEISDLESLIGCSHP